MTAFETRFPGKWMGVSLSLLCLSGCSGTAIVSEDVSFNADALDVNGLLGEYFDNLDFTNSKGTRVDSTLNFDWGNGQPHPAVGADTFSVRWTGSLTSKYSESYQLHTLSDDGIRVKVNGQTVIDNFTDHPPTENHGTVALTAGVPAALVVEFYENGWGAVAKLSWSSASQPKEVIPSTQLTVPTRLVEPWKEQDVGSVGFAGGTSVSGDAFTVRASGADIWDTQDGFHFVYQPLVGDGVLTAKVSAVGNTNAWAKAGVMIRESLTANSKHALMAGTAASGLAFQRRLETGGISAHSAGPSTSVNMYVRIERRGNLFTGSSSSDGVTFNAVGSATIAMAPQVFVGLAVTAHNNAAISTSILSSVALVGNKPPPVLVDAGTPPVDAGLPPPVDAGTPPPVDAGTPPGPLPAGFLSQDVGSVGIAGTVSHSGGVFTVGGAGVDIWDYADQFKFVYTVLSGDGEVVARVRSIQNTDPWAKAGVMIRGTLLTDSPYAMAMLSAGNGTGFQRRLGAGQSSLFTFGPSAVAPTFVKVVRQGNTLRGYHSVDGASWTLMGSDTVVMGSAVYAGLAVTSHNPAALMTATFDQVGVTSSTIVPPVDAGLPPPVDAGQPAQDAGILPGTRDKLLWPFASTSPWNMPIGSNAVYVNAQLPRTFWAVENTLNIMTPTAPLRTMYNNGQWWPGTTCNASGSTKQVPIPDGYVVPAPPSGGDGTLPNRTGAVLMPDGVTVQEFQYATRCSSTGPLTVGAVRCSHSIYGSGVGCFGAHGGSGLTALGGTVRMHEVTGTAPIRHAMRVTIPVQYLSGCNGGYRWPSLVADTGWNDPGSSSYYSGSVCALRMGSLVAIPPAVNCETAVPSALGRRICHALQDYGAYVVDTAPQGWNPMVLLGEWGTDAALSGISSDLLTLFTGLHVVDNNSSTNIGGGGTPRQPLAPPIGN